MSQVKQILHMSSTNSSVLACMLFYSQVSITLTQHFVFNSISKFFLVSEWQLWSQPMETLVSRSLTELMQELLVSFLKLDRPIHQPSSNGALIQLKETKKLQVLSRMFSPVSVE